MNMAELYEEQAKLRREKNTITSERQHHQISLGEIKNRIRVNGHLPKSEYAQLCSRQHDHITAISGLEKRLAEIKGRICELSNLEQLNKTGNHQVLIDVPESDGEEDFQRGLLRNVVVDLVALRSAYQSFAADPTRVSSMRTMAAEFVNKLNPIIRRACDSKDP